MSSYEVRTDHPGFDALRTALAEMQALAAAERVHLVDLGKAYQRLAQAMVEIAEQSGHPSVRFRAVSRALDLRTRRSEIEGFVSS